MSTKILISAFLAQSAFTPPALAAATVTGKTGCVGNACGAKRTTTGPRGGTTSQKAGCIKGACGGRTKVTGPNGDTASKTWSCSRASGKCGVRCAGPAGDIPPEVGSIRATPHPVSLPRTGWGGWASLHPWPHRVPTDQRREAIHAGTFSGSKLMDFVGSSRPISARFGRRIDIL